jgi:molybdenum cofactor cytidylyltransferase
MIFARSLFDQLELLHGDKAAWKLVDANAGAVLEVELALPFPTDINTREDFERIASSTRTPS